MRWSKGVLRGSGVRIQRRGSINRPGLIKPVSGGTQYSLNSRGLIDNLESTFWINHQRQSFQHQETGHTKVSITLVEHESCESRSVVP
jgi:hypothetical protein